MALLSDENVMIGTVFSRFAKTGATGTIALRGGIVAVNFVVMIGLAAIMGLGAFGDLAVIWGLALIASTALSCGAPLLLLRRLTDGQGLPVISVVKHVIILPIALAVMAFVMLQAVFPALDWLAVLAGALAINLVTCLASIMRALGSVQASMALRDAAPQVALGLAGVISLGLPAPLILMQTVLWLGLIGMVAALWCVCHRQWSEIVRADAKADGIAWSLWGTALLGMVLAQVDIVIGGSILSPEQIGLYAVLRRLANLVALPVSVATWVSAGPVSAAFGVGDMDRLQQASAKGGQIALIPGFLLFGILLAALPFLHLVIGQIIDTEGRWALVILAGGAFTQVTFASSFTVATLCGQARLAAASRGLSIMLYLLAVVVFWQDIGLLSHAGIYVAAITVGTVLLWHRIKQKLHVDTSAVVFWRRSGDVWTIS